MKKKNKEQKSSTTRKRLTYSPRKLKNALNEIKNGANISAISHQFGIPRTTLLYKSTGQRPAKIKKPGLESMLGDEIEAKICEWIQCIARQGFPITKYGLLFTVKKLFDEGFGHAVHSFDKDKGPGRRWWESFMARHPELTMRNSEYLHKARTIATESSIRVWYKQISDDLKDSLEIFKDGSRVFVTAYAERARESSSRGKKGRGRHGVNIV